MVNLTNDQIIQKATDLLGKHGFTKPPIDPEFIAENMGVNVVYVEFTGEANEMVHGFFDSQDDTIYVNRKDTVSEKMFTVAHELGHKVLHEDYLKDAAKYIARMKEPHGAMVPQEREADLFARALIAPKDMVDRYSKFASQVEMEQMFLTNHRLIKAPLVAE